MKKNYLESLWENHKLSSEKILVFLKSLVILIVIFVFLIVKKLVIFIPIALILLFILIIKTFASSFKKYDIGSNIKLHYINIPKERMALHINTEIDNERILYSDAYTNIYNKDAPIDHFKANFILLNDYLLIIDLMYKYCQVIPKNEILWIGPVKKEETRNHTERTYYCVTIFTRNKIFSVSKNTPDLAQQVCNELLDAVPGVRENRNILTLKFKNTPDDFILAKNINDIGTYRKGKYSQMVYELFP
jgi:hypothetical protein